VRVGYRVIVPLVVAVAGLVLFLGRLALVAQRRTPVTGLEGLVGEQGRTLTPLGPGEPGQIQVHGEIWRATAADRIPAGRDVRVVSVTGLTLAVEPVQGPAN
jgi:membrane-bound serine protease (ClpP class)